MDPFFPSFFYTVELFCLLANRGLSSQLSIRRHGQVGEMKDLQFRDLH